MNDINVPLSQEYIGIKKNTHTHKGWKVSKCHKRWPRRYTTVGGGELNFF